MNDLSQKKIFTLTILAIVFFGVGTFLVYIFLYRGSGAGDGSTPTGSENTEFPESGPGIGKDPRFSTSSLRPGSDREFPIGDGIRTTLFPVSDAPAIGVELSEKENKVFYFTKDGGSLMAFSFPAGTRESISPITIVGLFRALWSPAHAKVAVSYFDGSLVRSFLLGTSGSSTAATLPAGITSFSWSPAGSRLAYTTQKDGETVVSTADSSGKNQKIVFRTPIKDGSISWPAENVFSLETPPSAFAPGYVFTYALASGRLARFLGPAPGLMTLWSPAGTKVFSVASGADGGISSVIYDSAGKEIMRPDIQTLPQKCAWMGETKLYCAVPRGIPSGAIFPDDYLAGELATSDRILLVDVGKKTVSGIFNEGGYDMTELTATADGTYLFFLDRITGKVWGIEVGK